MVEVLSSRFDAIFPKIESSINQAAFIAIDTEFTGLNTGPSTKPCLFDTPAERYKKLQLSVQQYVICQIGLSAFVKDQEANSYVAHTFVFYLRPHSFGILNKRLWWQASSLEFLCHNHFDFNKFAYDGISYLNEEEEMIVKSELTNRSLLMALDRDIDESSLQHHCSQVSAWLSTAKQGERLILQKEMKGVSGYILLSEIRQKFASVWAYVSDDLTLIVEKVSKEKRNELVTSAGSEEDKMLNKLLGFTRVFRLLKDAKKPLVGHNLLMDLMLMYNQFYKPLPDSYKHFKQEIHRIFPIIFDTKHMKQSMRKIFEEKGFYCTGNLLELYQAFTSPKGQFLALYYPRVTHAIGFDRYATDTAPHEAGFDAYAAGYVFMRIAHILAMKNVRIQAAHPLSWSEHQGAVEPYKNKINLIRGSLHHLVLDGEDPAFERPQWLFVEVKSNKALDPMELAQMMSQHGSVDIQRVSRSGALIAAGNFTCARSIMTAFKNHAEYRVVKYNVFHHSREIKVLLWSAFFISGGVTFYLLFKVCRHS
ncbi:pre-piRNA 3'-exonuclease trimmer-like [Limulus polyphemus]|uniref:Pre-piRNA 3'-exonuclease trimmer-like n=1 Tax=Limulus polyphemus TaxID=6850 RepID=A0ABM1SHB4_LIMPO|nr:pre-piRNA 3'-exonuclease trimmer-like [Limulus polyphemus]XP_022243020.1 pre-piRNA 3'-exonuclease trimmer-like [Limulus polyphemus]XP_022243021.1 pre-piRNA 3'-exonuclease trimmer-like [Limulus polyphemus]XP_022243022.1 pre-piRNA 3'-exonuclease trimmer-like [Limulus polyphemus]XP_022243023.1 pre-piRNA 3'-exonuclease trimmer-like [Limulus polyphemus]XP_022243024.1 pre-piRNA 3'-exonuclease trimmer-like [Limulus polyphemus]XP_022243025.1 pre-piRNA 3'-exonuclease trimmer-like [Limulus polyphemu